MTVQSADADAFLRAAPPDLGRDLHMEITLPTRYLNILRTLLSLLSAGCLALAVYRYFFAGSGLLLPSAGAAASGWCAFLAPQAVGGSFRAVLRGGSLVIERGVLLRRRIFIPARQVIRTDAVTTPLGRLLRLSCLCISTPAGTVRLRRLSPDDAEALRAALLPDGEACENEVFANAAKSADDRAAEAFIGDRRRRSSAPARRRKRNGCGGRGELGAASAG